MDKSYEVKKVLTAASDKAYEMNSEALEVAHCMLVFLEAFKTIPGIEVTKASLDKIRKEADACAKKPAEVIKRYEKANIKRQIRPSGSLLRICAISERIANNTSMQLNLVPIVRLPDLFAALIQSEEGISMRRMFFEDNEQTSSKFDKIMQLLCEEECIDAEFPKGMSIAPVKVGKNNDSDEETLATNEETAKYCSDLVARAKEDNKAFIGRQREMDTLLRCLVRKDKPNAILTGFPGVGKTDIVRGLAKKIAAGDVPDELKNTALYLVDIPAILAGCEFRGTFEKRLKLILEMAAKEERPILFIDEIHMVLGAGKTTDSAMDAANILKPYLTEGKFRVIGATTSEEYRQHVEKDSAFMRRFQDIDVAEPSQADAVKILEGIVPAYEMFHGLKISKAAIKSAVSLSVRHMHDRYLPDKAIDIIDQACAKVKLGTESNGKVDEEDIAAIISEICRVPVHTVQEDDMAKVKKLDKALKSQVFGQDTAIDTLTEAIQMAKAGLGDETKPIGSFLFVGPSGVGKTEVTKQLAATLGVEFIRFDMSEYAEAHTIAKLIGSPAGYVGYEDGGILVERVRKSPNSVILFDEIEKAHPDIYKIFLQIFDYGMLTDNKGRKADFRNAVIVMTSNAGNTTASKPKLGFGELGAMELRSSSMRAISELMPPELRGRITSIVVFDPLSDEVAKLIVKKELKKLNAQLKARKYTATFSDEAIELLAEKGVSAQFGAREIQKVIDNEIKKPFVKKIIAGTAPGKYNVSVKNNAFVIAAAEAE